jgi:acetyl-CoA C-acetyltransferase
MQAIMIACNQLRLGESTVAIAGGMESMTNAPYLLMQARSGYRLGHGQILDHMMVDGLEDAYNPKGQAMGVFAENTAERYGFSRVDQDAFAIASNGRALRAWDERRFAEEVVPLSVRKGKEIIAVERDEPLSRFDAAKIPLLKPVFREGGTVTAANSSPLTDGAAAVVLMRARDAERRGLAPLALIHGYTTHSLEPHWFTLAPAGAIQKLADKLEWPLPSVDVFEINEAFAVVTMAAMKDLNLPYNKINIHGGACALGHPIGASGARLVVTLIHALRQHKLKRGIASLCIGGGEATALGLEIVG